MKTYRKCVCLTLKQAQIIVDAVFTEHLTVRGKHCPTRRDYLANKLIELMILPVGRAIDYDNQGAFKFEFDDLNCRPVVLMLFHAETLTVKHLALALLNSETYGDFMYRLRSQFNYDPKGTRRSKRKVLQLA